jgi:hypothetical protein
MAKKVTLNIEVMCGSDFQYKTIYGFLKSVGNSAKALEQMHSRNKVITKVRSIEQK